MTGNLVTEKDDPEVFDPPLPTPGAVHCGGNHHALPVHHGDGTISWRCTACLKVRVMADGLGWR